MNDVTYLFVLTPSSDVPVLPPTKYPCTCAFLPVPSSTTDCIILNTLFAVSFDITLSPFFTSTSCFSPVSESIISLTTLGSIYSPPLAILETAVTICNGVTSNLCPKLIVANSTGPTLSLSKNIPLASPGKSIPVFLKNPNFSK